jgi:twitching motility protein PilT
MEDNRLGAILLEGGVVDEAGLERCLAIQALTGGTRPIGQILVEQGLLSAPELQRLLDLQRTRAAARTEAVALTDVGSTALLTAARANQATEMVISEGRTVRVRAGCEWRQLTDQVLSGPEVWDFVREVMGSEVLESLAERHFVVRAWEREGLGRGSAIAFRQFDGVAVRITFPAETAASTEVATMHPAIVEAVKSGKGLVLVIGERGIGRSEALAPLIRLAATEPNQYVVVVEDEQVELPKDGALVVRRRYGLSPDSRAEALRSVVREDPDTLVIADVGSPATFEIALRAAEGGRLVIAYMDAMTSTAALVRALNFYPGYDLPRVRSTLAAVLRAVLVRHELPAADHKGTVVATEVLVVDDAVREVVRGGELADLGLLIRAENGRSGHSLDRNMLELLAAGRVRIEDVFARAEEKAWLLERTKDLQTNPR